MMKTLFGKLKNNFLQKNGNEDKAIEIKLTVMKLGK